jgi:hypothetical protein
VFFFNECSHIINLHIHTLYIIGCFSSTNFANFPQELNKWGFPTICVPFMDRFLRFSPSRWRLAALSSWWMDWWRFGFWKGEPSSSLGIMRWKYVLYQTWYLSYNWKLQYIYIYIFLLHENDWNYLFKYARNVFITNMMLRDYMQLYTHVCVCLRMCTNIRIYTCTIIHVCHFLSDLVWSRVVSMVMLDGNVRMVSGNRKHRTSTKHCLPRKPQQVAPWASTMW